MHSYPSPFNVLSPQKHEKTVGERSRTENWATWNNLHIVLWSISDPQLTCPGETLFSKSQGCVTTQVSPSEVWKGYLSHPFIVLAILITNHRDASFYSFLIFLLSPILFSHIHTSFKWTHVSNLHVSLHIFTCIQLILQSQRHMYITVSTIQWFSTNGHWWPMSHTPRPSFLPLTFSQGLLQWDHLKP
jgi:hypothetical protein